MLELKDKHIFNICPSAFVLKNEFQSSSFQQVSKPHIEDEHISLGKLRKLLQSLEQEMRNTEKVEKQTA